MQDSMSGLLRPKVGAGRLPKSVRGMKGVEHQCLQLVDLDQIDHVLRAPNE